MLLLLIRSTGCATDFSGRKRDPMKRIKFALLACSTMTAFPALAQEAPADNEREKAEIVVVGAAQATTAGTKTDAPLVETPQPIAVISAETFLAQGAISMSDTLRYAAGVTANPYGPDTRVDNAMVRGVDPLQFRDGMRDLFSYYASIRADPYNFSRVELVRGPASGLFGSGSLGGVFNMVSKVPEFERHGEIALVYGSFNRKEAMADLTGEITGGLAGRIVARVRDADTQTDHVPDDRVMIAPSLRWRPSDATDVTLVGLYQEDDGGSTAQFLPLVGTILPNPNGRLDNSLFIGKPGWDRYDGRLLQGTAMLEHRFGENVKLNLKARYIDSDLDYFTHYPDSYANPTNPYLDPAQRTIGLYSDGSRATLDVFSTDNNLRIDFNTGANVEHVLLAGVDYSWNRVRKTGGTGYELIDIYNVDYDALSDYGGGLPPGAALYDDTRQKQLGFYLQDQIRLFDRASIVLGVRRDNVTTETMSGDREEASATSFRAGVIVEVLPGISPFFSFTQSFDPIVGTTSSGDAFIPKRGRQFEAGIKFHPDAATLVTATAFDIKESNRPVDDSGTPDPFDQIQVGEATSRGFEIEASRMLPGNFEIIANYGYVETNVSDTDRPLENVPSHNASLWTTRSFGMGDAKLRLGAGVRYTGENWSYGPAFPNGIRTPDYIVVDGLVQIDWKKWRLSINATNLLGEDYYSACLARGDCFIGAERNVFATLGFRF